MQLPIMPVPPFDPRQCWFLTGPTAGGKTEVGLALAMRIGAEIISIDSMAIYRGMDIGTAKPTADQRRRVPHHLVDLLDPHEEFSLAQYVEAATDCAEAIGRRGRQVLFVGGTPLYLKGLLRGIFEGPPADEDFRRKMRELERSEPGTLHRQLALVDGPAARRLHPNDTRRLVRALEVYEKTGQPISDWQQQFARGLEADQCKVFVLDRPREELFGRVNRRVDEMFASGLVAEVRALLARPQPLGKTAAQAVGYGEVIEHLDGRHDLGETIELVKRHTRQFAKRQGTWFRSLSECRFLDVSEPAEPDSIVERILE